jgi:hypothetical protein
MEEGWSIEEVHNLNGKRVCDVSLDKRVIEIVQKGCLTRITANPDGTLKIENVPIAIPIAI